MKEDESKGKRPVVVGLSKFKRHEYISDLAKNNYSLVFYFIVKGGNPMEIATNVFVAFTKTSIAWINKVINSPAVDPRQFGSTGFVEEYSRSETAMSG